MTARLEQDPRRLVRRLYRGIDGFEIPKEEARRVRASKGASTYGEITPTGVQTLLAYLELDDTDVLYDLGAGVGKLVVQAAIATPVRKCVGIELARSRARGARAAIGRAREWELFGPRRCVVRCEDFMKASLRDATVVYTCSTAFSLRLMSSLRRKLIGLDRDLTFITLQEMEPHRRLEPLDQLRLNTTWQRRAEAHVYRIAATT